MQMNALLKSLCALAFVVTVGIGLVLAVSLSAAGRTTVAQGQAPVAAAAPANGFVGDDTCTACHESEGKSLSHTPHGKAQNVRTPAAKTNMACETCHGPGKEHSETGDKTKIRRPPAMEPREASEICLTCHTKSSHAMWKGGMHDARNLTCVTCHSIHSPKSEKAQLKTATVIETCVTCHKTEVAKLQRSGHMPLREAKMDCASCHDPHGSTNVRMLKVGNWINETCVSCHTEKRGPSCGITRRCAKRATPATIRTARTTIACSSRSFRCCASGAISARGIRRRSTTAFSWPRKATG
jgi:DmsE family decaheme c-type cytochrome